MNKYFLSAWIAMAAISCSLFASSSSCSSSSSSSHSNSPYPGGLRKYQNGLSPWVERKDGTFVYKINVFNLAEDLVCMDDLKSILVACKKDIWNHYKKNYGVGIDIKLYCAKALNDPNLFKGDRIPFFIVDTVGTGSFHDVQASEPANSDSVLWSGSSIFDTLGILVPYNFPYWTPYGSVSIPDVQAAASANVANNNPYGIQEPLQFLSYSINHEFKEILTDDSLQNWDLYDTYAPTVANWYYAEFDSNGNCTNGTVGADGYVYLPTFLDTYPAGGLLTSLQEDADPVSFGVTSLLNSYKVNHWRMTNYVTPNYWRGYYENNNIKWDRKGYVENPLQPYAGIQESLFFLDFDSGDTSFGTVVNYGPVTYQQRGDVVANNFPPDTTFVSFSSSFTADLNSKKIKKNFKGLLKRAPVYKATRANPKAK